ncbi:hypothetical protein HIM_00647 [Hirsutella minnesotensis 3608]|nr:hypothetical protein HIM_00647 [Hirsutella minnesotensis 3608]
MQRVSAFLPSWDKRNSASSKSGGFFGWGNRNSTISVSKIPAKINVAAANGPRVQREAYWPATLDSECDKAARILKSFCTDGYLTPDDNAPSVPSPAPSPPADDSASPAPLFKKIPKRIIQNAAGIAVFSCMRSGLWMTGSGGSGILIARKSDGTWSPPSGILLHTPTLSFIIGVDVYDCVLVINNLAALESITRPRVTLGEDVGLTNGPLVLLDSDEVNLKWKELGNTVLAYMKARGQHQAVNLNGCILTERSNENERFYEDAVSQMDILAGNVSRSVDEATPLFEVIKMAEGRSDFDSSVIDKISLQSAPGDAVIATPMPTGDPPRPSFGIPKADDPDPFGVLALEMAGLEIREAGSRLRPTSSQFDFNATPLSPSLSKFSRRSVETCTSRSNRASVMSSRTIKSQTTDLGTRNDIPITPDTSPSPGQSDDGQNSIERMPKVKEDEEVDYTKVDLAPLRALSQDLSHENSISAILAASDPAFSKRTSAPATVGHFEADKASQASSVYGQDEDEETNDADDEDDLDDEDVEEPVVIEVAAVQQASTRAIASRVIQTRGNVVTIPKRIPPPLPRRSPAREPRSSKSESSTAAMSPQPDHHDEEVVGPAAVETDKAETLQSVEKSDEVADKITITIERHEPQTADNSETKAEVLKPLKEDNDAQEAEEKDDSSSIKVLEPEAPIKVTEPEAPKQVVEPAQPEAESKAADLEKGDENDKTVGDAATKSVEGGLERSGEDEYADAHEAQIERIDNSDSTSHNKHTSSIYTGITEDRWSCDGSSITTPTSERRFSMLGGELDGDTPTKLPKEEEEAAARLAEHLMGETKETVLDTATVA